MTIAPRTAPSLGTIHFNGRLLSGPIPKGGKPVILEARSGRGAWIEFHVLRTSSRGRFSSSYRFKFPGPADYRFRVPLGDRRCGDVALPDERGDLDQGFIVKISRGHRTLPLV